MDQKTTPNTEVLIASASKKKYLVAMSLSSAHVDAFLEVARISSFSRAATTPLEPQYVKNRNLLENECLTRIQDPQVIQGDKRLQIFGAP
jgi:hypothetical protein